MASWGYGKFFALCSIGILGHILMDYCFDDSENEIEKCVIVDYRRQVKGKSCSLDAEFVLTRRGKTLYVAANMRWTNEVKKHVDDLKEFCKQQINKPRRCFGVKTV